MTERDRVRETGLKAAREREREREEGTLPAVEKQGEKPKPVGSCHHPELSQPQSLGLKKKKKYSLFLTYNSPLSVSQHQSAHLYWTQKRQDGSCESAPSDSWIQSVE